MKELRDYQRKCIDHCRKSMRQGKKHIMVMMPTGSGKTEVFIEKARLALEKNKKVMVIARRKDLVIQTAKRMAESLDCKWSVYMANKMPDEGKQLVVASADTIISRLHEEEQREGLKRFDFFIIDECHDCTSKGYGRLLEQISDKQVLGYTATPYRINKCNHNWWDECVVPITPYSLVNKGHLAPLHILVPDVPDLSGVKTTGYDYNMRELDKVYNRRVIRGNIIESFKKYCLHDATLIFACTISHARNLKAEFETHFNYKKDGRAYTPNDDPQFYLITNDMNQETRNLVLDRFKTACKNRRRHCLISVNIVNTGMDIPHLRNIIMARPTKSLVLFLQQAGRVTRAIEGKSRGIIIDHAANCLTFGHPYDFREPHLSPAHSTRLAKGEKPQLLGRACRYCSAFVPNSASKCEHCGEVKKEVKPVKQELNHDMVEFKGGQISKKELKKKINGYRWVLNTKVYRGFPKKYIDDKIRDVYGKHGEEFLDAESRAAATANKGTFSKSLPQGETLSTR